MLQAVFWFPFQGAATEKVEPLFVLNFKLAVFVFCQIENIFCVTTQHYFKVLFFCLSMLGIFDGVLLPVYYLIILMLTERILL